MVLGDLGDWIRRRAPVSYIGGVPYYGLSGVGKPSVYDSFAGMLRGESVAGGASEPKVAPTPVQEPLRPIATLATPSGARDYFASPLLSIDEFERSGLMGPTTQEYRERVPYEGGMYDPVLVQRYEEYRNAGRPSVSAPAFGGMQEDQVRRQMEIADAAARNQVPWYMRPPGMNERPNPVDPSAPSPNPSLAQPQRNQLTREAYERMLSNPSSFSVGGPSHSEASSWARTLASMAQSPFGNSMLGGRFSQFPYMSMGLGSMLGYGSPMMGGYNSYSFRGMPYGGYSQPMMGGMSYGGYGYPMMGGYGYPMMGGYGLQMMGGYGYPMMGYGQPMMGYSGYSSPMVGGYSPYGFSGMMGGLGSMFGSSFSSGSSGENPYGSPL